MGRASHICQAMLLNVGSLTKGRQECIPTVVSRCLQMWDPECFQKYPKNEPQGPKSRPGGSKIEAQRVQNRPQSPPRPYFLKMSSLSWLRRACSIVFWGHDGQLGSILEAQEAPKSRPKPEKIDVEKRCIFSIDFGRVGTSFWKGFW